MLAAGGDDASVSATELAGSTASANCGVGPGVGEDGDTKSPETAKSESRQQASQSSTRLHALRDAEQEWAVYPESNYTFESDSALGNKWGSGAAEELLAKRQNAYLREGTRRSVAAVLLVHRADYAHVLLLLDQEQRKHSLVTFKYKTWQKPREVLRDKLLKHLIKPEQGFKRKWVAQQASNDGSEIEVGDFLGEWWRGEFDDDLIPYVSPHVTRPKERVRIHQVQLPHRCSFRIPTGFCLTAVPVFDLPFQRMGPAISGLPHVLARFSIRLMLPTADKYEATSSLEYRTGGEEEADVSGDALSAPTDRPDAAGGVGEVEPPVDQEEAPEMLPPELQRLAELEDAS